jgi:hypothetical protein
MVPPWFALALLAIFVFFGAKQEEIPELDDSELMFNYGLEPIDDEFTVHTESEHPSRVKRPGILTQWLHQREQRKLQRQRALEAEEERRVDEILARVHQHGMQSLSDEEQALLKRVSSRYRNRISNRM